MTSLIQRMLICATLAFATLAVYWQARTFEFVNLDDPDNITQNALVKGGLSFENIVWAMRTSHPDYWRPLTWISFMVDHEVYGGIDPTGFHFTNIMLHALNVALLFVVLQSMTGRPGRSAFVAAAFALHPLHVESVAWVTERKDVLSGFFGLLSIWMYVHYARRGSALCYALTALFLGLGLMAKPMLVPLPFALLLLDIWPLRRVNVNARLNEQNAALSLSVKRATQLFVEKLPLMAISAASCAMTMRGGVRSVTDVPLGIRLANVAVSYVQYIGKMFWPRNLAVYYPYRGIHNVPAWESWQIMGSVALLLIISTAAILLIRRAGYIFAGWYWYLGTLVPVIGILQVGEQGMADRFVYFPFIGLYIAVVWGATEVARASHWARGAVVVTGAVALIACALQTWHQLQYWRNTRALYDRALAVTEHNWKVHGYYGNYLRVYHQDNEGAARHFEKYLTYRPDDARAHVSLGILYSDMGRSYDAVACFREALRRDAGYAAAHYNLGRTLARRGDSQQAVEHLRRAIQLDPANAEYKDALERMR
jgi:hypothetical protein